MLYVDYGFTLVALGRFEEAETKTLFVGKRSQTKGRVETLNSGIATADRVGQ